MSDPSPLASITVPDILEDIPEMAFIYRADGLLMAMNHICEHQLGVPRELVVDRFNLFANEASLAPALIAGYRAAFAGQSQVVPPTEIRLADDNSLGITVNRKVRWVETILVPLHRGADGHA